jgi:hypothetical protein
MCDDAATTGAGKWVVQFEDVLIGLVLGVGDGQSARPTDDRAAAMLAAQMLATL